jgi:hypothetical protein
MECRGVPSNFLVYAPEGMWYTFEGLLYLCHRAS